MKIVLKLAWRNIWRNWRRSLITLTAIIFAIVLSVVMRGIQLGTYEFNIKTSIELFTGYLQFQRQGYNDNPSLHRTFIPDTTVITALNNIPEIKGFSPRIYAGGLVSSKANSTGAIIFAIDPEKESKVSSFHTKVKEGEFIRSENYFDIVVGKRMLKNLNLNIGDTVVVLTSGYDGSMGNYKFRICGAFSMGYSDFDGMAVFMHIKGADELLSMNGRISSIAIALNSLKDIPHVKDRLNNKFIQSGYEALDWKDLMPDLKQLMELDDISAVIYLAILMLVVAFGILNTLLMSVTERFREFGVLLAIGIKHQQLLIILILEVIFLTLIGLIIGTGLSYLINYYVYLNPINLTGDFAKIYEEFGFIPQIHSTMDSSIFLSTIYSIIIITAVSTIYPAYRVIKLEALKGIRYT